jgi:hypothetical protein
MGIGGSVPCFAGCPEAGGLNRLRENITSYDPAVLREASAVSLLLAACAAALGGLVRAAACRAAGLPVLVAAQAQASTKHPSAPAASA